MFRSFPQYLKDETFVLFVPKQLHKHFESGTYIASPRYEEKCWFFVEAYHYNTSKIAQGEGEKTPNPK